MKSSLSVFFILTLFLVAIACTDGSVLQGEDNLSPEELLEKAQQPLKQTKGFAYTVQGDDFFYDVRANNEPFSMYLKTKVHFQHPDFNIDLNIIDKREWYLLQKHCYEFVYGRWGETKSNIVNLALEAPSPYDSINQASSLLSMLKEWELKLDKQLFTVKHEDGMYILEITNSYPSDYDPSDRVFDKIDSTFDSWFKKEFKVLLNAEGVVDQEYINQHPNEPLTNIGDWSFGKFRQSMWFDDQTFVLKKMIREVRVLEAGPVAEIKTEMNLKGQLKEKVVLPQQVIDQLE